MDASINLMCKLIRAGCMELLLVLVLVLVLLLIKP